MSIIVNALVAITEDGDGNITQVRVGAITWPVSGQAPIGAVFIQESRGEKNQQRLTALIEGGDEVEFVWPQNAASERIASHLKSTRKVTINTLPQMQPNLTGPQTMSEWTIPVEVFDNWEDAVLAQDNAFA